MLSSKCTVIIGVCIFSTWKGVVSLSAIRNGGSRRFSVSNWCNFLHWSCIYWTRSVRGCIHVSVEACVELTVEKKKIFFQNLLISKFGFANSSQLAKMKRPMDSWDATGILKICRLKVMERRNLVRAQHPGLRCQNYIQEEDIWAAQSLANKDAQFMLAARRWIL